jgi:DNA invertase Pin-like site-specific DNA recombinase
MQQGETDFFYNGYGDLGYARVSSEEQAQGYSVDSQVARLKAAGCTTVFRDVESAYKKDSYRPGFERMLQIIRSGQAKGKRLVVTNLDRLARNEVTAFMLFDELEDTGVQFFSLDQPYIDLSNPDGRVIAGFSVLEARAYSARLSRRVKQGHQHHRDRNAAYFPPFGYCKVGENFELDHNPFLCLLVNGSELSKAAIARDLVETFLACKSLRRSLRIINEKYGIYSYSGKGKGNKQARGKFHFGFSGLASWLNNPILRGHICYGRSRAQRQSHKHLWDIRHDTHPEHRLMSEEEYRQVSEILDWNSKHGGFEFKTDVVHPLSGLVYCGECRGRCRITHFRLRSDPQIKKHSYQCSNYHLKACVQKQSVREFVIEQAVIEKLVTRANAIANELDAASVFEEPLELRQMRSQLLGLEQLGHNPAIEQAKRNLEIQIKNYEFQLRQQSSTDGASRDLLLEAARDAEYWQQLKPEQKRRFFRALVDRVVVHHGQVETVILKV